MTAYDIQTDAPICYLLGAGPLYDYCIHKRPGDLIIAADGGLNHVRHMGLTPDVLLGDFDSLGSIPDVPGCIVLPREKDDTDMVAAAREGLARGYRNFIILGGTGGRADHTLANVQLLAFLKAQGADGLLMGEQNVMSLLCEETRCYPAGLDGYLSILAYGGEALVDLYGLKYARERIVMTPAYPLGTSNEFTGQPARIAVRQGSVLVIYTR